MPPYVDIHTHARSPASGRVALVCVDPSSPTAPLSPGIRLCSGVHPWKACDPEAKDAFASLVVATRSGRLSAIGESGIDRFRKEIPMAAQLEFFRMHIALSEEFRLPLVIHSVRSHPDILSEFAKSRPRSPWIVHGCSAGPIEIGRLLDKGISVSFGPRELSRPGARATLEQTPPEAFFLETDDSGTPIEQVYDTAMALLGWGLDRLASQMHSNWARLFGSNGLD